ncbi:MAG: hypothetical protein C0413_03960 [Clostridiales bacterium]|nr:hypothetical protein [Clostridiales bacterium]
MEKKRGARSNRIQRKNPAAKQQRTPDVLEQLYGDTILWVMSCNSPLYQPLKSKGCSVETPCRFHSVFGKILRAVFLRGNLPLQSAFYNPRVKESDARLILLVAGYLTTKRYLQWVRRCHPQAHLVLIYEDPILRYVIKPDQIPACGYEAWTFDPADAEKFGLNFVKGLYITEDGEKSETPTFDVCFFGKDKGRAEEILALGERMRALGLKPLFQIMPDTKVERFKKPFYQPYVPFSCIREQMLKSRAQLDYLQQGQSGISLRTLECMCYGVKLVTNNPEIEQYDIYSTDNVFSLGKRPLEELPSFLSTPFTPLAFEVWEQYTIEYFIASLRQRKQQANDREGGEPSDKSSDYL